MVTCSSSTANKRRGLSIKCPWPLFQISSFVSTFKNIHSIKNIYTRNVNLRPAFNRDPVSIQSRKYSITVYVYFALAVVVAGIPRVVK